MAILVFSPNGTYVTKPTLEAARTSADCAGKTIVITSALTATQSNITAAWPADRALEVKKGGSIANTTAFTISGPFSAGLYQAFTGTGVVTLGAGSAKEFYPQWFGAKGDGITDNTAAYNLAVAAITTSGVKKTLVFPAGNYKFTSGITLDISLMTIYCENCVFDFSGITTASTAVTVTATIGDIYSNICDALTGVIIKGPSAITGSSIGLYFNATTTVGPAHISMVNVGVTNFFSGISYGSNAYILTFGHCNIYGNAKGFQSYVGTGNNAGERITFINSSIFNNSLYGVRVEDNNLDLYLINTSLDYNTQAIYLGVGAVMCIGCHFEFSDTIGGNVPRFLYADAAGTNTSFVSFTACKFTIGVVASVTVVPVFDVTSTVTLSHANCEFYLTSNRSVIFKMRAGSSYNETGAKAQYLGANFRVLDSGSAYTIASTGQNQIGIKTTGDLVALAPNFAVGGVTPITDIFTAAYATGQVATSAVTLANGIYTLYTHTQSSADAATVGQYLLQRMGTQAVVTTISADAAVTVAVNTLFNVTVTNGAAARTLDCILVRNASVNI